MGAVPTPASWKGKDAGVLHHRVVVRVLPNGLTERLDHRIIRVLDDRGIGSQAVQAMVFDPAESTVEVRRARVRRKDGTIEELGDVRTLQLAQSGYRMYYDQRLIQVGFPGLRVGDTLEVAFSRRDLAARNMFDEYFGDVQALSGTEPRKFVEGLKRMGLGEPTGVMIPGEGVPVLRGPGEKGWSGVSLPWMSIGYELAMTPLQMLTFYNAVANNGRMMQPQLVSQTSRNGKVIERMPPKVLHERICSDRTLKIVHGMLRGVVDSGTAVNLKAAHFAIAGKTGTAQIAKGGAGYKGAGVTYKASFVGYFPADAPKYSCIVVVNGPTMSGFYGNVVAGPIFKEIADKIYSNRLELQTQVIAGSAFLLVEQ